MPDPVVGATRQAGLAKRATLTVSGSCRPLEPELSWPAQNRSFAVSHQLPPGCLKTAVGRFQFHQLRARAFHESSAKQATFTSTYQHSSLKPCDGTIRSKSTVDYIAGFTPSTITAPVQTGVSCRAARPCREEPALNLS